MHIVKVVHWSKGGPLLIGPLFWALKPLFSLSFLVIIIIKKRVVQYNWPVIGKKTKFQYKGTDQK